MHLFAETRNSPILICKYRLSWVKSRWYQEVNLHAISLSLLVSAFCVDLGCHSVHRKLSVITLTHYILFCFFCCLAQSLAFHLTVSRWRRMQDAVKRRLVTETSDTSVCSHQTHAITGGCTQHGTIYPSIKMTTLSAIGARTTSDHMSEPQGILLYTQTGDN